MPDVSQTVNMPTTLPDEGFLSDEVAGVIAAIRQKYAPHLREVRAINALLTRCQYVLEVHPQSAREMTSAALYVRSLAHCQAAFLLLERGMAASARAMTRCALEGLFNLGACATDWKVALSFIDADQVDRRRRANYLSQVQDPAARAHLSEAELAHVLLEIQAKIDETEAHGLQTRQMAKTAGLEDLYLTAYAMLSGSIHSSAGDLDQHFRVDPADQKLELITEPVLEGLEGPILILSETMVGLVRMATKVCSLSVQHECEEHLASLHRLCGAG
jgi:hypothetical protein